MATNNGYKTVNEIFIEACKERNSEKVKAAIKLGCDVNFRDEETNCTGLMLSAGPCFSLDVMDCILQAPDVKVNTVDNTKTLPVEMVNFISWCEKNISTTSKNRNIEMKQAYNQYRDERCQKQRKVYYVDSDWNHAFVPSDRRCRFNIKDSTTALHVACHFNKPEAIKRLGSMPNLDVNINENEKSGFMGGFGFSKLVRNRDGAAMTIATNKGHLACLRELVHIAGADLNIKNHEEETPIMIALKKGLWDIFSFLVEISSVDLNTRDISGDTLIMHAFKKGNTNVVKTLIGKPTINFNLKDESGDTLIMQALKKDDTELVKTLIGKRRLNLNIKDQFEDTLIMLALKKDKTEIVKTLIEKPGLKLNVKDAAGDTPIMYAIKKDKMDIFTFLAAKPEVNFVLKDVNNKTVEQLAREKNMTEYLKLIPGTTENQIEVLTKRLHRLEAARPAPECPVCFNPLRSPPMFQCVSGHIVCGNCKPRVKECPTCRERMMGRAHDFEKFLSDQ